MPYYLTDDKADLDPRWMVLAEGKENTADLLFAYWHRIQAASAKHSHNGYVTHHEALDACRGKARLLQLLLTPVLGQPPLVHRKGDSCAEKNCIDASPSWVDGFDYRVCSFSKRNPTKQETDRNRAQKADSRNKPLKDAVYARDGGCCRYCGSGPLPKKGMGRALDRRKALQFDHVDPDREAGIDGANYVVACARCNEHKGHRTPAEADMVLLPEPTEAERAALLARPLQLRDFPEPAVDNHHDNRTDNRRDKQPTLVPSVVGTVVPDAPLEPDSAGDVRLQPRPQPTTTTADPGSEGSGSGRGGQPVVVRDPRASPYGTGGQITRTSEYPDVYHRRPRLPATPEPPQPGGDP
ncbi:HNH endonuclease [Amycolatopsis roodepoortensis]|uniref:HNH endonuclease n=1 Tax=Amycolatopsis roodepoortensis TaxID=700274 RepID=UPI00214ADB2D|nr:HNH endonuclease [Amycolatopsis roodepoortensis]UUV34398.1 HNH endonuclease [Amycolatopsis roodepoortensis]